MRKYCTPIITFVALYIFLSCSQKKSQTAKEIADDYSSAQILSAVDVQQSSNAIADTIKPQVTYFSIDDTTISFTDEGSAQFPLDTNLVLLPSDTLVKALIEKLWNDDNRIDYYEGDPLLRNKMDNVFTFFRRVRTRTAGDSIRLLTRVMLGVTADYCQDEAFFNQPSGARCSGFAISKHLVLTAGHCFTDDADLANHLIVYGYRMDGQKNARTTVHRTEVFKPLRIKKRFRQDEIDFALIEVENEIPQSRILLTENDAINLHSDFYVVGYPLGLPVKYADGGRLIRDINDGWFTATLDTYQGNSGSPVFSGQTDKVVGLLIKGDSDFAVREVGKKCLISNVCTQVSSTCNGEYVIKIDFVKKNLGVNF